jgi:hypothetical protein
MKRVIRKIHHFTKRDLAAEEIIIIIFVCVLAAAALAASAILPIRATIVQCGPQEDLPAKCREDQRCCALLETVDTPEPQARSGGTRENGDQR